MDTLLIVATLLLGIGILSLCVLLYLSFRHDVQPGSLPLVVLSSLSTGGMILGDIALGMAGGLFAGHIIMTVVLGYLTLLPLVLLFITLSIHREKPTGSACSRLPL
jgi:hypothetical protein